MQLPFIIMVLSKSKCFYKEIDFGLSEYAYEVYAHIHTHTYYFDRCMPSSPKESTSPWHYHIVTKTISTSV
jgi:hypothetical protein